MKRKSMILSVILVTGGLGYADEAETVPPAKTPEAMARSAETSDPVAVDSSGVVSPEETPAGVAPPVHDPFAVSQTLQAYASPEAVVRGTDQRFLATGAPPPIVIQPIAVPKMRMLAYLRGKGGEPVALLEVENGQVHVVREGDAVGLHEFGSASVVSIKRIDRLHLVVEVGTLGRVIIVR